MAVLGAQHALGTGLGNVVPAYPVELGLGQCPRGEALAVDLSGSAALAVEHEPPQEGRGVLPDLGPRSRRTERGAGQLVGVVDLDRPGQDALDYAAVADRAASLIGEVGVEAIRALDVVSEDGGGALRADPISLRVELAGTPGASAGPEGNHPHRTLSGGSGAAK